MRSGAACGCPTSGISALPAACQSGIFHQTLKRRRGILYPGKVHSWEGNDGMAVKRYDGPVRAVILDWAGTVVDFGSRAPMSVFVAAFAAAGVDVSVEEAKPFMGLPKRDHIRAIGALPDVARRWEETHKRPMTDADVDTLHARLLPLSLGTAAGHAGLIPGARNTLAELRRRGIAVGSTTGYSRAVMDVILDARRRVRGLRTRLRGLHRRRAGRTPLAADVLSEHGRTECLAGGKLHQSGRHRSRYRGKRSMPACGPSR